MIKTIKTMLIKIFTYINSLSNKMINYINKDDQLKLTSLTYNQSGRFLIFYFTNNNLKNYDEVLKTIYNSLMNNEKFINFGFNKNN